MHVKTDSRYRRELSCLSASKSYRELLIANSDLSLIFARESLSFFLPSFLVVKQMVRACAPANRNWLNRIEREFAIFSRIPKNNSLIHIYIYTYNYIFSLIVSDVTMGLCKSIFGLPFPLWCLFDLYRTYLYANSSSRFQSGYIEPTILVKRIKSRYHME